MGEYMTPTRGETRADKSLSKGHVRRQLPPVGTRLRKRITGKADQEDRGPQWGEVIYVNYEHLLLPGDVQRVRVDGEL